MRFTFLFFIVLYLSPFKGISQKKISFGKVTEEELKMKYYEKDSSAAAVILSDVGFLNGRELKFTRHVRIKILTKAGLEWGNWVFNTPTKSDFSVFVFNLENGEIQKERVDKSSIYNEEIVDGFNVYKVFAPNVRVGSVIDIKFSFFGIPFQWWFQDRIPVAYSELTLEQSDFIQYSKSFFGFHPIETVSESSWKAKDVPSFKMEPFLNSFKNYITKFEFQILSLSIPRTSFYYEHSKSWKNIINNLLDSPYFGAILNSTPFLNDAAAEIRKNDSLSADEKIKRAYRYIQSNIKWNGVKAVMSSEDFKWNFKENHTGNSAEVNLSLIYLLNKIGIETYPLVLSTRDNGILQEFSPSFDKLNYVVALIIKDNSGFFLDATSENLAPGFLPDYCINLRGLLVKRENEQWYTLYKKEYVDLKKQYVVVNLDNATAKANITQEIGGYAFLEWVSDHKKDGFDVDSKTQKLKKGWPGTNVSSYQLVKKDVSVCLAKESFEVDFTNNLISLDNEILFSPLFFHDFAENPFKTEERKYPLDFVCNKDIQSTVIVNMPKGYRIKEKPESIKFSTPDGGASFSFLVGAEIGKLQFKLNLKINRHVFSEGEYLELKQFFVQVAKLTNSPIQLIKT